MNEPPRGAVVVGVSIGPTGPAGPSPTGAPGPVLTWLTDSMIRPSGVPVPGGPGPARVTPALVFVMGDRLAGPGTTCARALAAVESVWGGAVLHVPADPGARPGPAPAAPAAVVTGPIGMPPSALDLSLEAVLVEVDGAILDSATGAAVLGHPGAALALAADDLARRGRAVEAGWLVLPGGLTAAVAVPPGASIGLHFSSLGSVFVAGADPADARPADARPADARPADAPGTHR